jgi:hypothetical protein
MTLLIGTDVPPQEHQALVQVWSVGHLNANIKGMPPWSKNTK